MAHKSREKSEDVRNIGRPPACVNPQRRAEAGKCTQAFCEIYLANIFTLAWSPDQIAVLKKTDDVFRAGGLEGFAMPRGGGKTSIAEASCLRASLYGHKAFLMMLAVSATKADDIIESLKTQLLTNELLLEDFPEVCYPIQCLEDRANKARGQHCDGQPTYVRWQKKQLVLPAVRQESGEWFPSSGVIIRGAGLTSGAIRGPKWTRPHDGRTVRPDVALIDDPQDDECAGSAMQVEKRHRLIHSAVLGMAGPGKKIAAAMPCTVIRRGDLAERILDRQQSPLWNGQRYKLIYRFPDKMNLWEEYAELRAEDFRNDGDGSKATVWYGQRRDEMDAGALVAWPERFKEDELGPVQHAMNLLFLNRSAFFSEYQNEPEQEDDEKDQLQADVIMKRLNGLSRGAVPLQCGRLTAFIDVQKECLFWMVCGFSDGFDGAVVDYGVYPEQPNRFFTKASISKTLARVSSGAGFEGALYAGLEACGRLVLGREFRREDGAALKIEKCLVDANWGLSTATVKTWCRQSPFSGILTPSHGKYIGAASKPWSEYQKRPGERLGFHWLVPVMDGKSAVRHVLMDVNHWKSFVAQRLLTAVGDRGALTLFGDNPEKHRLFSQHMVAEYRVRTEGRGRKLDEWRDRPERPDNDWWDCLVGCHVAASMQGIELKETAMKNPDRKHTSAADYQAKREAFRRRTGL